MRLLRGRKEKPKTDVQEFSDQYKDKVKEFHKRLNDSRYSIYAIRDSSNGQFIWEANFCSEWLIAHPNLDMVLSKVANHSQSINREYAANH